GQSLMLATLRDWIRLADGTLILWRSPQRNLRMRIAAAAPFVPWSDLTYALQPNGRTLDYVVTGPSDDLSPIGVAKQSYLAGLFAPGLLSGYYAPAGVDPSADLQRWFALVSAGEPYDPVVAGAVAEELAQNHSAYYLSTGHRPAPILIANGFTDDLFP